MFVEIAEHEFFQTILDDLFFVYEEKRIGWPRLRVDCKYILPLTFGDTAIIELFFRKLGPATIVYDFKVERTGEGLSAEGQVTIGCCKTNSTSLEPIVIPEPILKKISAKADRSPQ